MKNAFGKLSNVYGIVTPSCRGEDAEGGGSGKGEGEARGMAPRVYGTLNRQRENTRSPYLSLSLSLSGFPRARASFRHYELSEDTLAQICKADNSARRVGRDEGSGGAAGGQRDARRTRRRHCRRGVKLFRD